MNFQLFPCPAWPDARFRFLLRSVLVFFLLSALFLHCALASASGSLFRLQHRFGGRDGSYRWSRGTPMRLQDLQDLRSHDRLRHHRLLLSAESYPLGGIADPNIAGLYFTEIQLGTPPSKYYVQIDTGSDLLWLNCASCKTCPQSTDLGGLPELCMSLFLIFFIYHGKILTTLLRHVWLPAAKEKTIHFRSGSWKKTASSKVEELTSEPRYRSSKASKGALTQFGSVLKRKCRHSAYTSTKNIIRKNA